MMRPEPIVTERLTLRPWRKDDADALFAAAFDPAVGTPAGFPPHKTHEHSEEVLRDVLMKPEVYAICIRASEMPGTPRTSRSLKARRSSATGLPSPTGMPAT